MAILECPIDSDMQARLLEISRAPILTAEDERELGAKVRGAKCAASRDRLVQANLRLVVAIAKSYAGRGLAAEDLLKAGTAGLCRAVEDFDPEEGARFSLRAGWWIRQAMRQALRNAQQPKQVAAVGPGWLVESPHALIA